MRRRTLAGIVATGAAAALVVGVSIVWPGLDAQETPEVDTSVWALQSGERQRYARVNTAIHELDTVRTVSNPSQVAQSPEGAFLFSDSNTKITRIDESLPVDLDDAALQSSTQAPAGTVDVVTAGDYVAYLTDAGAVFAGRLSTGASSQIDPFPREDDEDEEDDAPQYAATAIAVDERGMLFAYSIADGSVIRYDLPRGELAVRDALDVEIDAPELTAAGDAWSLVDADGDEVWLRGRAEPVAVELTGAIAVNRPDPDGSTVFVADESGLDEITVESGEVTERMDRGASTLGEPAQPIVHDGDVFAAWLGSGETGGTLWSASNGPIELDYGGVALPEERRPVFVATDEAVILNETRSGWVWTVPDGELVLSSQDWTLDDRTNDATVQSEEQLEVVVDPKPPIAEPDAFGVRAGRLATLPVLLNDHDPNEDVLSVDPASVSGLDPGFGTVSLTDDGQRLAVSVDAAASGSASFQYAVTDGTSSDGLLSNVTTVTLTVSDGDAAPEWCGVDRCLTPWPAPEVALGGTVTVPVLPGWVDPDGDPLLLLSVENRSGIGTVASTPAGEIVYQHSDDGTGGEQLIELDVTVSDTAGQTATKPLVVRVSPEPKLSVQSFAVVDTAGVALTVDVAPHVSGTAGTLSLTSVRVLDDAAASAGLVGGTTTFDFSASEPGTYRVDFTVSDGKTDATGTARITMLAPDAPAQLATSPVVAFVHPQEDATLDVFTAVSNPTRRVLLLSDVVASADEGASLTVDSVGQSNLRVAGTTATGAAGRLGTVAYTVSDGTEDEGARITGEATVYLLPPAPELAPIAVDDAVVVRAGSQIDIPVLDNDVSPAGGRPILNPASVLSSSPEALAFASNGILRYLAPTEEGTYGVDYNVYTAGSPALFDTATVKIQVLPADTNRPPVPDRLEGRVLSGGTTAVEFDGFGMDPDGDVVTLDRIVQQPERGAASISADGESIVYTSIPGDRGQVSFRYRVVDAAGATGEGTVRIGVLDGEANPSPITFTDYVQVQTGESSTIRVSPLANDVDPTQGTLTLTAVRPDLPDTFAEGEENPEYARLAERITSTTETGVVISAGTEPGTMSFLYDVASDSGNTGRGLIVVKVVRESVPDYPVVADTVLSAENRDEFTTGVDVLTGRAAWSGGDVDDLEVRLWGEPAGVTLTGRSLSGELPATTRLIPFAVTGTVGEQEITTYAFLRVPGDEDIALALRSGTPPLEVLELESVDFDMSQLVVTPRGAALEIGDDVRSSGARADSSCTVVGGSQLRYSAGEGAPWTDACQVPVRLSGTEEWTYLSVPVLVSPLDPQPLLKPASLTVGPGETATFDLRNMTTWQLREDWDNIQYSFDPPGAGFTASLSGSIVTVTGADNAVPGSESAAVVGVTSHNAVSPARLILRVGAAPSTLPQGGSTAQLCSQASGGSCTVSVIGASGEVNPLPRTPLQLVDVRPTGACVGVSFRVASATTVAAAWSADAPGATCTAAFSVRDAQGRVTAAERDGRIMLDLQGFPKAPAAVRQTAYADGTVTLRVDAGQASQAYPGLSGFIVRTGGQEVARCSADGACPPISAPNGEQRVYDATAVNSVGESKSAVRTTAWAYDTPASPRTVTSTPDRTRGEGLVATLEIEGIDAGETGYLEVASPAGETRRIDIRPNQTSYTLNGFRVGSNSATTVTVTPYSRFQVPPGLGGQVVGQAKTVQSNGVGAPLNPSISLSSESVGGDRAVVRATATAQANGTGSQLLFGIAERNCNPTNPGNGSYSQTIPDLDEGEEYEFVVCVASVFGGQNYGDVEARQTVRVQISRAPNGWTYTIDKRADVNGQRAEWRIDRADDNGDRAPRFYEPLVKGLPSTVFNNDPQITVQFVRDGWAPSAAVPVLPAQGSPRDQVAIEWRVEKCIGGEPLQVGKSAGPGTVTPDTTSGRIAYFDKAGLPIILDGTPAGTVPNNAASVRSIPVKVSPGQGLNDADGEARADCTPKAVQPSDPPTTPPPGP